MRFAVPFAAACFLAAVPASAGELVYQPVNPSFGGNPLNGDFLLQQAKIQNQHEREGDIGYEPPDPTEQFADNLERQLLNGLATNIANRIYPDGEDEEGLTGRETWSVGSTTVVAEPVNGEIRLTIEDALRGTSTTVTVPAAY